MLNPTKWQAMKQAGQAIMMLTCYDATSAKLCNDTPLHALLVGDSAAMVMHGHPNTVHADMQMMLPHVRAVAHANHKQLIVADMPFLSYRSTINHTMQAVTQFMQAGAHAIKLEGCQGNLHTIQHLVESGIPVMGHIGLTPQFIHQLGGWKVQGKTKSQAQILLDQAKALAQSGVFAIVIECVPSTVAAQIAQSVAVPCIGIGAGADVDGQILVMQDLLGLNPQFAPKFSKSYLNGAALIQNAITNYCTDIQRGYYPAPEHCYETDALADESS